MTSLNMRRRQANGGPPKHQETGCCDIFLPKRGEDMRRNHNCSSSLSGSDTEDSAAPDTPAEKSSGSKHHLRPSAPPRRPLLAILTVLLTIPSPLAAQTTSYWPPRSQPCMDSHIMGSGCVSTDAYVANYCLCNNNMNWASGAALCLGQNDPANLDVVYGTMRTVCGSTSTPIVWSLADWQYWSGVAFSSSGGGASPASTTTSGGSGGAATVPTSNENSGGGGGSSAGAAAAEDGGLKVGDKIAIGVGVPGGIAAIGCLYYAWRAHRRGRWV